MGKSQIELLLRLIDEAFDRKSWHGTNLAGAIRGLDVEVASWRPQPRRHNIWEIVIHAAYWKYVVWRQLTGGPRGSFPVKGSNWFRRPEAGAGEREQWKADVASLRATHRSLRNAVAALDPKELITQPKGSKLSRLTLITGIAAHDLYHAGQIQLLKRLSEDRTA
jgi:hypothetical protein